MNCNLTFWGGNYAGSRASSGAPVVTQDAPAGSLDGRGGMWDPKSTTTKPKKTLISRDRWERANGKEGEGGAVLNEMHNEGLKKSGRRTNE